MDSQNQSRFTQGGKFLLKCFFVFGAVGGAGFLFLGLASQFGKDSGLVQQLKQALHSAQEKAERLKHSEETNIKLSQENAELKLKLESNRFDCTMKATSQATQNYELKLEKETGSRVGRSLMGLNYKVPEHLSAVQLYTLGVQNMKAQEHEKVAVIFTTLTGLEESERYKSAQNYLITGVAWYQLENFHLANYYLDLVLKQPDSADNLSTKAQARLWKALTAKMTRNESESQVWLKDLLDHHPHSSESEWVNSGGAKENAHSEN